MEKKNISIPFDGFYESISSSNVENNAFMEWNKDETLCDHSELKDEKADEFWNYYMENAKRLELEYSKDYADGLFAELKEHSGIELTASNVIVDSPREYNFRTDRIFLDTEKSKLLELYAKLGRKMFAEYIKENFTSCDGFSSFYDNSIESAGWSTPEDYDHNQWNAVIACLVKQYEIELAYINN